MSLIADLETAANRQSGPRCSVAVLLEQLSPSEADALNAALANTTIYSTTIAEVLKANGHPFRDEVIARHRRKTCRCP